MRGLSRSTVRTLLFLDVMDLLIGSVLMLIAIASIYHITVGIWHGMTYVFHHWPWWVQWVAYYGGWCGQMVLLVVGCYLFDIGRLIILQGYNDAVFVWNARSQT